MNSKNLLVIIIEITLLICYISATQNCLGSFNNVCHNGIFIYIRLLLF